MCTPYRQDFPAFLSNFLRKVCCLLASNQCDQMPIFVFQNLVTPYDNKHLPTIIKIIKFAKTFAKDQITPQKSQTLWKLLPKWQNFANSGHTALVRESYCCRRYSVDYVTRHKKASEQEKERTEQFNKLWMKNRFEINPR